MAGPSETSGDRCAPPRGRTRLSEGPCYSPKTSLAKVTKRRSRVCRECVLEQEELASGPGRCVRHCGSCAGQGDIFLLCLFFHAIGRCISLQPCTRRASPFNAAYDLAKSSWELTDMSPIIDLPISSRIKLERLSWTCLTSGSKPERLSWAQTPPHARARYVLTGYRPVGKRLDLFDTLFQLHNETANVWVHLVAAMWFAYLLPHTGESNAEAAFFISAFRAAAAISFVASAFCHAIGPLLPMEQSMRLWRWDLIGILVMIGGSYVPGIGWGFRCRPVALRAYATIICCSLVASIFLSSGRLGSRRNFFFVLSASVSVFFGCALPPANDCISSPLQAPSPPPHPPSRAA